MNAYKAYICEGVNNTYNSFVVSLDIGGGPHSLWTKMFKTLRPLSSHRPALIRCTICLMSPHNMFMSDQTFIISFVSDHIFPYEQSKNTVHCLVLSAHRGFFCPISLIVMFLLHTLIAWE